jgi:hypothetical protein
LDSLLEEVEEVALGACGWVHWSFDRLPGLSVYRIFTVYVASERFLLFRRQTPREIT